MADGNSSRSRGFSLSNMYRLAKIEKDRYAKTIFQSRSINSSSSMEMQPLPSTSDTERSNIASRPLSVLHSDDHIVMENDEKQMAVPSTSHTERYIWCTPLVNSHADDYPGIDNDEEVINSIPDSDVLEDTTGKTVIFEPPSVQVGLKRSASEISRNVALTGKMSVKQVRIMLREFHEIHPELPLDVRTLLETPRNTKKTLIDGGEYVHIKLSEAIIFATRGQSMANVSVISLQLHIDGMSLFKNSKKQLWPILGRLVSPKTKVFAVGLFSGETKPKNVNEYLEPLITDLLDLYRNGIVIPSTAATISFKLDCIIGDAPARAYMKQVKSHSGYFSCERCTSRGQHVEGKMVFDIQTGRQRTDADFRRRRQEEHHVGISPFEQLPVDMIFDFPFDYMHTVCLGMMKKLVKLWKCGPTGKRTRLATSAVTEINDRLQNIRQCIPSDFQRKCRSLEDHDMWKATECRQFLLYVGPIATHGILPEKMYENFLNFSICFRVLCSPRHCAHYLPFVTKMLQKTVEQYSAIYGKNEVSFNFHCLLHVAEDARLRGTLDGFSAFAFESHLRVLRSHVRSPTSEVAQIFRRVMELNKWNMVEDNNNVLDDVCGNVDRPFSGRHFQARNTVFGDKPPENAVFINGRPGTIDDFDEDGIRMYQVIEFDDDTVAIVPKDWVKKNGKALWPKPGTVNVEAIVRKRKDPPPGSTLHDVRLHKATNDYDQAKRYQKMLEELSEIPSSDATTVMDRFGKRKLKPVLYSDSSEEDEKVSKPKTAKIDIDYSPPPPPLEDMSQFEQENVENILRPLENIPSTSKIIPVACSSWIGSPEMSKPKNSDLQLEMREEMRQFMIAIRGDNRILREEVRLMRSEITKLRLQVAALNNTTELKLPVNFPMRNMEEWSLLNSKMEEDTEIRTRFIDYLSKIGGSSYGECTRNVLRAIITEHVADQINWRGTNNRVAIHAAPVSHAVIEAVLQQKFPRATHNNIKEKMQKWIQKAQRKLPEDEKTIHVVIEEGNQL